MTQLARQNGNNGQNVVVMRRRHRAACRMRVLREASTGQVVGHLPRVWAVAGPVATAGLQRCSRALRAVERLPTPPFAMKPQRMGHPERAESRRPELAFYRKYTEALLRRYMRLSLEAGRVPSLMGREMFRGNVTHYRVHNFEDVVIFCHDMEKRLAQLGPLDQQLVKRLGLQQYTLVEVAGMLGLTVRIVLRRYVHALDGLTEMFLEDRLLEPGDSCQEGKNGEFSVTV
jgi:hypothetical protein